MMMVYYQEKNEEHTSKLEFKSLPLHFQSSLIEKNSATDMVPSNLLTNTSPNLPPRANH
jgi:hypothetical protein